MKMSLRVTLMATLLTMTVSTVAAIGYVAYRNAGFAAGDLTAQILDQDSRMVDGEVGLLLEMAERHGQFLRGLLDARVLDDRTPPGLMRYWAELMKSHPRFSRESLGIEATGEWSFIRRLPDGELAFGELKRDPSTGLLGLKDYRIGEYPGRPFAVEVDARGRDARLQPWYVDAKRAGRQAWSLAYPFTAIEGIDHVPGVSCSTPIFDGSGKLRGVSSSGFDVVSLCRYLEGLAVGKGGFAFIVEVREGGDRRVIAHPDPKILIRGVAREGGEAKELVPPDALADRRVAAFLAKVPAGADPASHRASRIGFDHEGARWIGAYRGLSRAEGPGWLICIAMPEVDVMGRVYRNNRETLLVGMGILGVAALVGLGVAAQVARPLERVARETERIGRVEVAARPVAHSMIREVDRLAIVVEETKTSLRSFGKFVPLDLVRRLLASGLEATPGGERRRITVSFCDLANFTTLAEELPPEELVLQLADYFGRLSDDIAAGGGTVDKYIGDAIMALWGAPRPSSDHAVAACVAAIRNQASMEAMDREWRAQGKPELAARIGIMTGEAILGNIGSDARLNYTAMGDTVNLASRLEGLGKAYGARILIGEPTYHEARDAVIARPVDWVSVKGKSQGMLVYEVLALKATGRPDLEAVASLSGEALGLYRSRDWSGALAIFEQVARLRPGDGPSRVLIDRCRTFLDDPPPDDWDGIHRMATK